MNDNEQRSIFILQIQHSSFLIYINQGQRYRLLFFIKYLWILPELLFPSSISISCLQMENIRFHNRRQGFKLRKQSVERFHKPIELDISEIRKSDRKINKSAETNRKVNTAPKFTNVKQANKKVTYEDKIGKEKQEIINLINFLDERACTFYTLGFKTYERNNKKQLFKEIFDLQPNQMKGTLHVGQLWSTSENNKFLRENKINMTKLKLMEEFRYVKNDVKRLKKRLALQKDNQFAYTTAGISSITLPNSCENLLTRKNSRYCDYQSTANVLKSIQHKLKGLKQNYKQQKIEQKLKILEFHNEKINRMEKNYGLKLIQF